VTRAVFALLLLVAPARAAPLPPDSLRAGDVVYLIWPWKADPIRCEVRENGPDSVGHHRLELTWPDPEGGTAWTAVDPSVVVYADRAEAQAHRVRRAAADLAQAQEELRRALDELKRAREKE
jgi:hypothetical protein